MIWWKSSITGGPTLSLSGAGKCIIVTQWATPAILSAREFLVKSPPFIFTEDLQLVRDLRNGVGGVYWWISLFCRIAYY